MIKPQFVPRHLRTIKRGRCTSLIYVSLLTLALHAQTPATNTATASSEPDDAQQALAALKQRQPEKALSSLVKAIASKPSDATLNLLAASTAIELNRPDLAVTYGERARALDPDDWKIDTTLVTAYAMAGKRRERDLERSALHALHASGKERDAKQASGFLLDRFTVKHYTIDAVEYFVPIGKFHIYYCFFVRDAQGQRVWQINAQSDDFNQVSWARAYPAQAAGGQRQFQLTGEGSGMRKDYRSFSGSPDYDWIKAHVIDIVNAQATPFPGEREATNG